MPSQSPPLPGYLSWPVVILALVCLWPVGLVLLGMRLSQDRAKQMMLGGVLIIVGTLVGLFFLLAICVGLSAADSKNPKAKEGNVATAIICGAISFGGFALAWKGVGLRRKRRLVQGYIELIVNQGLSRVDEIAIASERADFGKVMTEIQGLIKEGFLPGYRVDVEERRVIRAGSARDEGQEVGFGCQSCGAKNMIFATGAYIRCEYCDTPVKV